MAATPAPSASTHLGGESIHTVPDSLLADFARHFGEHFEDVALTVALDVLQCIHEGLANFVAAEDENAPVPPAEVSEVLG
jgi:hypothetical protein